MAVVKTERKWIVSEPFQRVIRCDKNGSFASSLPANIAEILGVKEATGDSMQECEKEWDKLIGEYTKSNTQKRKVIHYHINTETKWAHDHMQLEIGAHVIEETCVTKPGGKAWYSYKPVMRLKTEMGHEWETEDDCGMPDDLSQHMENPRNHGGDREECLVEFTPESLEFFVSFHRAFKALIEKVDHLTGTPELLLSTIKKGMFLLPPPSNKNTA